MQSPFYFYHNVYPTLMSFGPISVWVLCKLYQRNSRDYIKLSMIDYQWPLHNENMKAAEQKRTLTSLNYYTSIPAVKPFYSTRTLGQFISESWSICYHTYFIFSVGCVNKN